MKHTKKMLRLLERMAAIDRMERGKVCQLTGRRHYNHQTWRNGRNEVRYVREDDVADLRKDIAAYRLFIHLAEQYADEVIRQTRRQREKRKSQRKPKS